MNRNLFPQKPLGRLSLLIEAGLLLAAACGAGCGGGGGGGADLGGQGPDLAPQILAVEPKTGPISGGEHVVIFGSRLASHSKTEVFFGGVPAEFVAVQNGGALTCVAPAHAAGAVAVKVVTAQGSGTLSGGFVYTEDPSILWLACNQNRNELKFAWGLSEPGDEIVVFRGSRPVATLPGGSQDFAYSEKLYGVFRFTVALHAGGQMVDSRDFVAHTGRVRWTPPWLATGYYAYVAEAVIPDPYALLPYDNPYDFDLDVGPGTELPLELLFNSALVDGDKTYFLAMATYVRIGKEVFPSELSAPVTFRFAVEVDDPGTARPAPPAPRSNGLRLASQ